MGRRFYSAIAVLYTGVHLVEEEGLKTIYGASHTWHDLDHALSWVAEPQRPGWYPRAGRDDRRFTGPHPMAQACREPAGAGPCLRAIPLLAMDNDTALGRTSDASPPAVSL